MANYFQSGTTEIPANATELSVTGLGLTFTPRVQASVRQPASEGDIVNAYVVGTPTTDGFSVVFSAPVPTDGYKLDWTAFSAGGDQPVSTDTLAADYTTIANGIAAFLGYDASGLTNAQKAEIDGYIQSGIRQFYYPPMMEGVDPNFEWSFLRQNGSVSTTAGVSSYVLPDGFGRFAGQLVYRDAEARHSVPVIPYGDILRMINGNPDETGRPRFAAMVSKTAYGSRGQRKELYMFPKPDAAYTLDFACDADTGRLDADTRPYPCGGPMFAELVIESCLAIAEQKANDEAGLHTSKFQQLLVSMIQRDRKGSAQVYGYIGDPDAERW